MDNLIDVLTNLLITACSNDPIHRLHDVIGQSNSQQSNNQQSNNQQSNNQQSNNQQNDAHWWFRYPFFLPLIVAFLSDEDVVLHLLLTTKAMKHPLSGYRTKSWIKQSVATRYNHIYLPISFTKMDVITNPNLVSFPSLTSAHLTLTVHSPLTNGMLPLSLLDLHISGAVFVGIILPPKLKRLSIVTDLIAPIAAWASICLIDQSEVLPETLEELELGENFNQSLPIDFLPSSLTSLAILGSVSQSLLRGALPTSLTSLKLYNYGLSLDHDVLPPSLTHLELGQLSEPLQVEVLPSSLTHLSICYPHRLSFGVIPSSIKTLRLFDFSHELLPGDIPAGVTHLELNGSFDHPLVSGVLPDTLVKLFFGNQFNQPITAGTLPESLKVLYFGFEFNQPIEIGALPLALETLHFDEKFNRLIPEDLLPTSLTDLQFDYEFNQPLTVRTLPRSLQTLSLGRCDFNQPLCPGVIPYGVTELHFSKHFSRRILPGVIPASVKKLYLGRRCCAYIRARAIPASVTELHLSACVKSGVIPPHVTHLDLLFIRQPQPNVLLVPPPNMIPPTVTHLRFNMIYHPNIVVPSSVTHVSYPSYFSFVSDPNFIPKSATHVELPHHRFYDEIIHLPPSVKHLYLPESDRAHPPKIVGASPRIWWGISMPW